MLAQHGGHDGFNPQLFPKENRHMKWKDTACAKVI